MAKSKPHYGIWPAYGLALLFLVGLALCLMSSMTPFGCATSPDSISYLDIASHFKSGDGWRSTDVSLGAVDHPGVLQNRAWPPLYPFLLSTFVSGSTDVVGASRLSGILLVLTAFLTFLLARKQSHWLVALGAATAALLSIPVLTVFTFAWSEAVFVPLMLFATFCAVEYLAARDGSRLKRSGWFCSLVLALVLLPYTRYIGIVLALLLPMSFALSRRDAWDRFLFFASLPLYIVPVGFLLRGNYQVSGELSGTPRQPSDMSLSQNLQNLVGAFLNVLPHSLLALSLAAAAAIVAGLVAIRFPAVGKDDSERHEPVWALSAFVCLIYLAALVLMRTHTRFDQIDTRLIAPSLPLLLIAVLGGAQRWAQKSKRASIAVTLGVFLVMGFAAAGYEQFRTSAQMWLEHADPELPMRGGYGFRNFTQQPSKRSSTLVSSELIKRGVVVVADRALIWRFVSGFRAFELPPVLDTAAVNRLRNLPAGSVLLLKRSELQRYLGQLKSGQDYSGVADLGELILIHLSSSKQRN